MADRVDRGLFWRARTLREIEQAIICPLHGYKTPQDYWEQNNPATLLSHIAVPTLLLHAEDDPVAVFAKIPQDDVRANPNMWLVSTRRGGHIGWNPDASGRSWADRVVARFLEVTAAPRSVTGSMSPVHKVDGPIHSRL
eukprot:gnl/TRDRNA2_/TRDRNA2_42896_c0_seq1.p1 gnl/TRDRNA2_/TRDRNA2_42896_c0~~gnl/TRDRNA2_/TRDRNA2_42896_c0_seq1.p1  ORF type:complete len:139 (-),score=20.03 gnl/TRDRNA2_/TRDRNA2_42896_c0_seq1:24-440(-)